MATRYIKRQSSALGGETQKQEANSIYVDSDTNTVKVGTGASGTSENELCDLGSAQTISGAKTFTGNVVLQDITVEVGDDDPFTLGDDNDSIIVHNSGTLAADTALSNVLVGTPVTEALAANSTIVSNLTASGDILVAANVGGTNSEEFIKVDASVGALYLSGYTGGIGLALATDYPAPDLAGEAVHIWDGTAGAIAADANSRLIIETNDTTANYLTFLSPNASKQGLLFGDPEDANVGGFTYNHSGNVIDFVQNTATISMPDVNGVTSGVVVGATISYTEDASSTTHTGTVEIPAAATITDIVANMGVLWAPTGACTFSVGDDDSATGWFNAVNMKATDWLVGEVLSAMDDGTWGGKNGTYLTAAGVRGQAVAAYSGSHTTAATEVIGVASVTTPAATAGRSYLTVTYVAPTAVAATVA